MMVGMSHPKNAALCHGTTGDNLERILKEGIKPRKMTGKSNWEKFPSKNSMVYLTTAYPFYFSMSAVSAGGSENDLAVIEVDRKMLDETKFYPDEDFMAQVIAPVTQEPLEAVHKRIVKNLHEFRHMWKRSLSSMGTMAYSGHIPPEAIKRCARVDTRKRGTLRIAVDPTISVINYTLMGAGYERFTLWLLGYDEELPALLEARNYIELAKAQQASNPVGAADNLRMFERNLETWTAEAKSREGIEIIDMRDRA